MKAFYWLAGCVFTFGLSVSAHAQALAPGQNNFLPGVGEVYCARYPGDFQPGSRTLQPGEDINAAGIRLVCSYGNPGEYPGQGGWPGRGGGRGHGGGGFPGRGGGREPGPGQVGGTRVLAPGENMSIPGVGYVYCPRFWGDWQQGSRTLAPGEDVNSASLRVVCGAR